MVILTVISYLQSFSEGAAGAHSTTRSCDSFTPGRVYYRARWVYVGLNEAKRETLSPLGTEGEQALLRRVGVN